MIIILLASCFFVLLFFSFFLSSCLLLSISLLTLLLLLPKLRELLPQIGALQLVQSDFCFDGRNFSNAPRLFQQDLAGNNSTIKLAVTKAERRNTASSRFLGGALLDVGVYVLNFAHIVFGDDQLPQKYHAAATFGVLQQKY